MCDVTIKPSLGQIRWRGIDGAPMVLVVQAGPGLPVFHEIRRYQSLLKWEQDFRIAFWERPGTGPTKNTSPDLSPRAERDRLVEVIGTLATAAHVPVIVLGVSIGATLAMQARGLVPSAVKAVLAISPDIDAAASDQWAWDQILRQTATASASVQRAVRHLGPGPYLDPARFQARAQILGNLNSLEYGVPFSRQLLRTLSAMLGTYGPLGTARTLGAMQTTQKSTLAELAKLKLTDAWPTSQVPVHYFFGDNDLLCQPALVSMAEAHLGPGDRLTRVPQAGHMVHFDRPGVIRSALEAFR